jgi:hypothetical protein
MVQPGCVLHRMKIGAFMIYDYSAMRKDHENVHFMIQLNEKTAKSASSNIESDLLIQKVIIDAFKHLKNSPNTEVSIEITEISGKNVSYVISGEEHHRVYHIAFQNLRNNQIIEKIKEREITKVGSDYISPTEINRVKIQKLIQKFREDINLLEDQVEKKINTELDLILIQELNITNQIQTIANNPLDSEFDKKINLLISNEIAKLSPSEGKVLQHQKKTISASSEHIGEHLSRELEVKLREIKKSAEELFVENGFSEALKDEFESQIQDLIKEAYSTFIDQNNLSEVLSIQLRHRISPEGINTKQYGFRRLKENFRILVKTIVTGIVQIYAHHLSSAAASRLKLDFNLSSNELLRSLDSEVEKETEVIFEKLKFPTLADYIDSSLFTKKKLSLEIFDKVMMKNGMKDNSKKIAELENRWKVNQALSYFDKINKSSKEDFDPLESDSPYILLDIHAIEMPLDALKEIKVTEKNKGILTRIWNKQLNELYLMGGLYNVSPFGPSKDLEQKLIYAEKYLATKEAIPMALERDLEMFHKVEMGANEQQIRDFLIANLPAVETKETLLFPENALLNTYQKELIPLMDRYINGLISQHKSVTTLKGYLSDEIHPYIVSVAQVVMEHAKGMSDNITNQKLEHEILCRLRRNAIEAFSVSEEAWDQLRGIQQAEQLLRTDKVLRKVFTSELKIRIDSAPRVVVEQAVNHITEQIYQIEERFRKYRQVDVEKINKSIHKIEKLTEQKQLLQNVLNDWEDRKNIAGEKKLVLPGSLKDVSELTMAEIANEISKYKYDDEEYITSLYLKFDQLRRTNDFQPFQFKEVIKKLKKFNPYQSQVLLKILIETTKLQSEKNKILSLLKQQMLDESPIEIKGVTFNIAEIEDVAFIQQMINQNNIRILELSSNSEPLSVDGEITKLKKNNEFLIKLS